MGQSKTCMKLDCASVGSGLSFESKMEFRSDFGFVVNQTQIYRCVYCIILVLYTHVKCLPFLGWACVNPIVDLTRSSHIHIHSNYHQGILISLSRGGLISPEVNPIFFQICQFWLQKSNHLLKIITQHVVTYPRCPPVLLLKKLASTQVGSMLAGS